MLQISNHKARLLWLKTNALLNAPHKQNSLLETIKTLGFVQLDSIQNVTRAQNHILWSRHKDYKEQMLDELLLEKGSIFEHFSHDACVLPVEFYPVWKLQFHKIKAKIDKSKYYKNKLDEKGCKALIKRIQTQGPLSTSDFESQYKGKKEMWARPPHKTTLDYLWYCGQLSTAYRKNFKKYYDLSANIIPNELLTKELSKEEQIHWLCTQALHRLSIATPKELKNFWDALSISEVNAWLKKNTNSFLEVEWENAQGTYVKAFAVPDIKQRLKSLRDSKAKIQIINPFDPAVRDRERLKNIFGFEYKIEIFVPKAKRVWGYYVYPLLQGKEFIGRIELQADRKKSVLSVINFWKEEKILWNEQQQEKLEKELVRLASFIGVQKVVWA